MTKRSLRSVIAFLFVISGGTGLIYQIAWFKYLSLFLGNSTYAQSVVLATFMGGLAIGAALWGRRADRTANPLRLYAILEIGIAAYCLLYPTLLSLVKRLFTGMVIASDLPSDGAAVLALKLVVSLLTLLVPTILMGGTLPVLVKFLTDYVEESGKTVARLYFVNSLGAVLGSALGGFYLIQSLGLSATVYAVAVINLTAGVVALLLAGARTSDAAGEAEITVPPPATVSTRREVSIAVLVAGLSGVAAMIYEVAWVRLLIPVLGSSTYSFTLMLVAFISGITFGSWLVGVLLRYIKNLFGFLAICQAGVAVSLLLTLPLYGRVPYAFWQVSHILARSETTYPLFLVIQFAFGFVIMFVPTIFLGMTLPAASRIAAQNVAVLGRTVGNVFSVNTLGTVIGALAAGLALIPLVGIKYTIAVGVLLNLLGAAIVLLSDASKNIQKKLIVFSSVALVALFSLLSDSQWNKLIMLSGVFRQINRNTAPPASFAAFTRFNGDNNILYYEEGAAATVAVVDYPYHAGREKVLFVNGKPDASSRGDLPTQVLLGQIPLMLHQNPKDVCVIGLGSGVTLGSVLTHNVRSVDCVEILPEVVGASARFDDVNNRPLSDPRTHLYVDDALSFLKLGKRTYDVIVSEPTNPWIAGVGNLFTKEFFEKCHDRLAPGGIMVQWFHLYEMDDEIVRLVLRTMRSSFANVSIWQPYGNDIILVGSDVPVALNADQLNARFAVDAVKRDFYRLSVPNVAAFLSLEMVSEHNCAEYAGAGDLNTEDLPLLEYGAPRSFFVNRPVTDLKTYDERSARNFDTGNLLLRQYQKQFGLTDEEKRSIGMLHSTGDAGNLALGYSFLLQCLETYPHDADLLQLAADVLRRQGKREEQLNFLARAVKARPDDPLLLAQYAWESYQSMQSSMSSLAPASISGPEEMMKRCFTIADDTVDRYHVLLGDMYAGVGNSALALAQYRRALEIREFHDPVDKITQDALLMKYARTMSRVGDDPKALAYALQAFSFNPDNTEAKEMVYAIHEKQKSRTTLNN